MSVNKGNSRCTLGCPNLVLLDQRQIKTPRLRVDLTGLVIRRLRTRSEHSVLKGCAALWGRLRQWRHSGVNLDQSDLGQHGRRGSHVLTWCLLTAAKVNGLPEMLVTLHWWVMDPLSECNENHHPLRTNVHTQCASLLELLSHNSTTRGLTQKNFIVSEFWRADV